VPRLSATLEVLDIDTKNWLEREHRTTFVHYRRMLCSQTDALTIEVPTILCESCFGAKVDGILVTYRGPDVLPESWESDLANLLDDDIESIAQECDFPRCQSCRRNLHGEALYVETVALAERLGISDETSRIKPSKRLRNEVLKLYGRQCFGCGVTTMEIDHIEPRKSGGKAAFENLQPLCRKCGNGKADRLPRRIVIVRNPWSNQN
jgi:5-methylcytosine-specific restriction endonuclease McrA